MAITRAIGSKTRSLIILGLVLSLFATGLIVLQTAAAAGTPLLAIGNDVIAADQKTVTYRVEVRNAGNGQADNVRVKLDIPSGTTFESSSRPPSPADGAVTPACDNGGTREPFTANPPTTCEWLFGSLAPGTLVDLTYTLNILPLSSTATTATTITTAPKVTGTDPGTGAATQVQSDSDGSLKVTPLATTFDTWVDRAKPKDTSYGGCPVLTTRGNGTATAYADFSTTLATAVERVWAAQLQATVAASDYSAAAPGTLALHAIKSGDWTEDTGPCPEGKLATGSVIRTGSEPAVEQVPTATSTVGEAGPIAWDVLADLDGAFKRTAFQGWEIRNTTGSGSVDIHAKGGAAPSRVVVVHTISEPAGCIDVDPESSLGFPTSEQILTATVYDNATDRRTAGSSDACNGTPVAGHLVTWEIDKDGTPDVYFSNQAGTPIPKSGTATDAGPDTTTTTTDSAGHTFVGIRLADPLVWSGDNRVASCSDTCGTLEPASGGVCDVDPRLDGACTRPGESRQEDDVRVEWSPNATPQPEGTSTPAQSPPTISSFSPAAGPVGTSVLINGSNFNGTSAVRFNGATAAFTVNSPSRITTSVPSGATDGPISVQNAAGTTVSAGNFDVTASTSSTSPPPNTASPGSGSPNPTVSAAGLSPVDLTLTTSDEESTAFAEVVLSGTLASDNPLCAQPGTTIEILKREAETTTFQHVAYVNTGVGGLFEYEVAPEANTIYSASVGEHSTCAAGRSTDVVVLVSPEITITSTVSTVEKGRRFWITGSVLPKHQLTSVTIWRKTGPDQWKKVGEDFLDASSRYALALRYKWTKPKSIFITRWKTTDADHISGQSPRLRINRASSTLAPVTVHIRSTKSTVAAGGRFRVKGAVKPAHPLSTVTLWKKKGSGKFKKITTAQLDEDSRYSFRLKYRWKRAKSVFVVRWKTSDEDHASGRSARLIVKRAPRSGAA